MAYLDFYLLTSDDGEINIGGRCQSYELDQNSLVLKDVIFYKGVKLRRLEQLSSPTVVVQNAPIILIERNEREEEHE